MNLEVDQNIKLEASKIAEKMSGIYNQYESERGTRLNLHDMLEYLPLETRFTFTAKHKVYSLCNKILPKTMIRKIEDKLYRRGTNA